MGHRASTTEIAFAPLSTSRGNVQEELGSVTIPCSGFTLDYPYIQTVRMGDILGGTQSQEDAHLQASTRVNANSILKGAEQMDGHKL